MQAGQTYAPTVTFNLSGQANGKQPYWNWDYKDICPAFRFCVVAQYRQRLFHKLFGGAGKTSIRGGYGITMTNFGQGITNSFDRNGSFGLSTSISNPAAHRTWIHQHALLTFSLSRPPASKSPAIARWLLAQSSTRHQAGAFR